MATTTTQTAKRSYRYVHDEDAQFEECNGEARPLTAEEYAENSYQACPLHWRAGTVVRDGVPGCAACGNTEYEDIPYAEYLRYYGNPERHVYLELVQQTQCPCCGEWKVTNSLGSIDFMDDSPELRAVSVGEWMSPETGAALPGYAGECIREMENEASDATDQT